MRTLAVCAFPRTLIVHLKRFIFHGSSSSKVDAPVSFPHQLDPWVVGSTTGEEEEGGPLQLVAFVCHFGSELTRLHCYGVRGFVAKTDKADMLHRMCSCLGHVDVGHVDSRDVISASLPSTHTQPCTVDITLPTADTRLLGSGGATTTRQQQRWVESWIEAMSHIPCRMFNVTYLML